MMQARAFAQFDHFYALYRPLTPMGRRERDRLEFFTDKNRLEREYDGIELFADFLKKQPQKAEQAKYFLRQISAVDDPARGKFDSPDIFLFKRLLHNSKRLFALLPAKLRAHINAYWQSDALLALLSKGGDGPESFHLSEKYSPALAAVRAKITETDAASAAIKQALHAELQKKYNLDFRFRSFVLVPAEQAKPLYGLPCLFVEPYDNLSMTVRPVYGQDFLALAQKRDELATIEKKEEKAVLSAISKKIAEAADEISGYINAVTAADVLLAKAEMTRMLALSRPRMRDEDAAIEIANGRLPAVEEAALKRKLKYQPLNCALNEKVILIHGSNMGGKTVALQTITLLQLAAQHGFFVPAEKFSAPLVREVCCIGEGSDAPVQGLSSFGLEMFSFTQAFSGARGRTLFVLDEFARTTNSREAAALLSAVAEAFAAKKGARAIMSTHFGGIRTKRDTGFYRMRGFDRAAFEKYFAGQAGESLEQRLRTINRFMRYELIPADDKTRIYDAVAVAAVLGVDKAIISAAEKYMEAPDEEQIRPVPHENSRDKKTGR